MKKLTKPKNKLDYWVVFKVLKNKSSLTMIKIDQLMNRMEEEQKKCDEATYKTCPICKGDRYTLRNVFFATENKGMVDCEIKEYCSTCKGIGKIPIS